MNKEEAWKVIDSCKNWNTGQKSTSFAFGGARTEEDDIYDAKRAALKEAWKAIGQEKAE